MRTGYDNPSSTDVGTVQLPTGGRIDRTSRTGSRDRSTQNIGIERRGTERVYRPREERNPNVRSDRGTRSTRTRETRGQERRNTRNEETPTVRDNGSSRNTVPTYSLPTVRMPSAPPPTFGGGSRTPANTGTRGGNTRSGRR